MQFPEEFNFHTKEWVLLEAMLKKDLENAVGSLCNLDCEPTKTEQLRGRIAYIKSLLSGATAAVKERQRTGGPLNV